MPDLTLTLVHSELVWEHRKANLDRFEARLQPLAGTTDLVILPEMFSTGFTMNAGPLAETLPGPTLGWMQRQARQLNTVITGSVIIREDGRLFNRLLWVNADGSFEVYDKRHLFRMSGEHEVYAAGRELLTVTLNGWRVRPFICYDLRFPSWCRNRARDYDLAVFVANWPAARADHWRTLLRARAIENQCYVVGVNRVGTDGNGLAYRGDSAIIGPRGTLRYQGDDREEVFTATLARDDMERYREAFPAWKDAGP